jgi:hypothetical protein
MTDLGWSIDLTQQAAGNPPAAIETWCRNFELNFAGVQVGNFAEVWHV